MCHLDVEGEGKCGDAAPFGRAAGPGGVEVADIDRPLGHQVAAARGAVLALTGADSDPRAAADVAHRAPVVRPAARLLEPREVAVLDESREANRLRRRPGLVRVGGE